MKSIPRLTVVVLVFICRDDALLLVKQSYGQQYWSLPGGVVELGESLEQAAIREVKEETGLDVRLRRVVGLYSKPDENSLAVTFEGEAIGGTLMPNLEVSECCFFPLHELPEARDHLLQRVDDFLSASPYAAFRSQ